MITTTDVLERTFESAVLLGGDIDESFRVLALTVEPDKTRRALLRTTADDAADPRWQLLCHPVSTVIANLQLPREKRILTFTTDEFADVLSAVGGGKLRRPIFGAPEPHADDWGPQVSFRAQSNAPDGRTARARFSTRSDDTAFDLFVRCDVFEVRDATGDVIATTAGPNDSPG
ncbi:MAG: hypothetical protein WD011_02810 [Nitriliruptoraceae bacterium]